MNKNPAPKRYVAGWSFDGKKPEHQATFSAFEEAKRYVLWGIGAEYAQAGEVQKRQSMALRGMSEREAFAVGFRVDSLHYWIAPT